MVRSGQYVVGLDIGTTTIRCVVVQIADDGGLSIIGLGEAPSRGLRKGLVVNPDATVDAIKSAVGTA